MRDAGPAPETDAVGRWLAALMRASSELLDAYVFSGQGEGEGARRLGKRAQVVTALSGAHRGEVRCAIDDRLALAIAEGMWGKPRSSLSPSQITDAARELCGQIIGYAAGEVSSHFPGVVFEPPRLLEAAAEAGGEPGELAVVPTRLGALRFWVSATAVPGDPRKRPDHLPIAARDRIRSLRDTDLQLMQAVGVLSIDDQAEDAFEQLVRSVGSDPVLSARVLRRVNSAHVRRGHRIVSLPQALLYLGTRSAKNIVISALLSQPVGPPHPARLAVINHCIHVAELSRLLGRTLDLDAEECYLLGLLHDLGRLVLDRLYPDEMLDLAGLPEEDVLGRELRLLGINHAEAGAIVAATWNFPESVRLVMAAHHDREVLGELGLPAEQTRQAQVVTEADRLAEHLDPRGAGRAQAIAEAADRLHLSVGQVQDCLLYAEKRHKEESLVDTV